MKKMLRMLVGAAAVGAFMAPATANGAAGAAAPAAGAQAALTDATGKTTGLVVMAQEAGKVRVVVAATGLTPGFHGIHIHAVGKCDAPDFTSAGGHFALSGQNHGDHAGDFPPLFATADGTAVEVFTTDRFAVSDLFDSDSSAVIVHAGRDNLANIPARYSSSASGAPATGPDATTLATGDSGARVACGVVQPASPTPVTAPVSPTPRGSTVAFGETAPAQGAPANASPIVAIAPSLGGSGYWLGASDGGVFTGGGAPFLGSMGGKPLNQPMVGLAATPDGKGYWLTAADGGIFNFGDAPFMGSTGGIRLNKPVVGIAARPANASALVHDATGAVVGTISFSGSDAGWLATVRAAGLTPGFHGMHIHSVGLCDPPGFTGAGGHLSQAGEAHGNHDGDLPALLAGNDGTAEASFATDSFTVSELLDADGSAVVVHAGSDNYGNIPSRYSSNASGAPATGADATTLATGDAGTRFGCGVVKGTTAVSAGYWTVASDGGVFAFGNAPFLGSLGDKKLNAPIVGMAATPSGLGYWLVASDGGVFSFGDAAFFGSLGDKKLNAPIVGIAGDATGLGYWLVGADGGVFTFGSARFFGSEGGQTLATGAAGLAPGLGGHGYWIANR